ncbi:MAG: hypothetical protein FJW35_10750 [Acidobacteria bacterium]|nr:hypothetical protein [Acidobacteriota bacterium]
MAGPWRNGWRRRDSSLARWLACDAQSAATAACIAIDKNTDVQSVPYKESRARLLKDGQRLDVE